MSKVAFVALMALTAIVSALLLMVSPSPGKQYAEAALPTFFGAYSEIQDAFAAKAKGRSLNYGGDQALYVLTERYIRTSVLTRDVPSGWTGVHGDLAQADAELQKVAPHLEEFMRNCDLVPRPVCSTRESLDIAYHFNKFGDWNERALADARRIDSSFVGVDVYYGPFTGCWRSGLNN